MTTSDPIDNQECFICEQIKPYKEWCDLTVEYADEYDSQTFIICVHCLKTQAIIGKQITNLRGKILTIAQASIDYTDVIEKLLKQ